MQVEVKTSFVDGRHAASRYKPKNADDYALVDSRFGKSICRSMYVRADPLRAQSKKQKAVLPVEVSQPLYGCFCLVKVIKERSRVSSVAVRSICDRIGGDEVSREIFFE